MTFTLVDVILILIIFAFVASGFFLGLIRSIGALIGLVAGTWMAGRYFMPASELVAPFFFSKESLVRIIAFFLIFAIVNRLVVLLFYFIDKLFFWFSFIPFAKQINRFSGVVLGLLEGVLTVGVAIYVIAKLIPSSALVVGYLDSSQVAHYLVAMSEFLTALLPGAFAKIKTIF